MRIHVLAEFDVVVDVGPGKVAEHVPMPYETELWLRYSLHNISNLALANPLAYTDLRAQNLQLIITQEDEK